MQYGRVSAERGGEYGNCREARGVVREEVVERK